MADLSKIVDELSQLTVLEAAAEVLSRVFDPANVLGPTRRVDGGSRHP